MQATQEKQEKSLFLKGVTIGAVVGGTATLLNKDTRQKVKQNLSSVKGTVSKTTSNVKENPRETKDDLMTKAKNAAGVLKEAVDSVQKIYDKANDEIVDDVKEVKKDSEMAVQSVKEIKQDSKDALNTVNETKQDLKSAGSKAKQAKDELAK
ncbi:hypothetical protein ACFO3D_06240 [Virgibacillus kekensis]|uniref:General stress protein n=1 Tax=Virgibacillus kekensis TaxID=202261 RepID=A0ABV9DGV5_9BACI